MCEAIVQDDSWERAAAAFQQRWGRLPTAGRQTALHQFGGARGCRRNATQIPVQSTSTARRTSTNVRGRARRRALAGRAAPRAPESTATWQPPPGVSGMVKAHF